MSSVAAPLTIAVPKGRSLKPLAAVLKKAGLDESPLLVDDRRLVRESKDGSIRYLFLKPDDVPTYVEYGAADAGVCGRDVLLERKYDLYEPIDLGFGKCRLVVAGKPGEAVPEVPRVATKFPRLASEHFAKKGIQAEIIQVGGSVELAPIVHLSHLIVDLVETGVTLKENGLEVIEVVTEISTVVVVNRASYKLRRAELSGVFEKLRSVVAG